MQLKRVLLGTALALVASAGAAQAGTMHGWYLNVAAGANWIQDGNFNYTTSGVVTSRNNAEWETGWAAAAAVGYDFSEHWRAEFEVAYRHNGANNICNTSNVCTASWSVWELSQMVNVYYDIPLSSRWQASVGAGIGGNLVTLKPKPNIGGPSGDDYVFAGQLIAQLAYQLSDRWQIYADYHFMMMSDPHPDTPSVGGGVDMEKTDHAVMIGLRFDLQSDHAPPPEPERPRPVESKPPKQFIVFFGFNKSNLSSEAVRVVSEAAAAAKQYGSADIIVVGHTDTVGSPSYNMRLSLRRAAAVKSELSQQGIKPSMIHTEGKGETELMVQTGDGVKEPQNRRATIDLE
jgi:outer membrane protein OmpA-like peptidoglycan-associated protein